MNVLVPVTIEASTTSQARRKKTVKTFDAVSGPTSFFDHFLENFVAYRPIGFAISLHLLRCLELIFAIVQPLVGNFVQLYTKIMS